MDTDTRRSSRFQGPIRQTDPVLGVSMMVSTGFLSCMHLQKPELLDLVHLQSRSREVSSKGWAPHQDQRWPESGGHCRRRCSEWPTWVHVTASSSVKSHPATQLPHTLASSHSLCTTAMQSCWVSSKESKHHQSQLSRIVVRHKNLS